MTIVEVGQQDRSANRGAILILPEWAGSGAQLVFKGVACVEDIVPDKLPAGP